MPAGIARSARRSARRTRTPTPTRRDARRATAALDTIQLAAATYPLTLVGANEEANLTGDLDLRTGGAGPMEIVGAGAGAT